VSAPPAPHQRVAGEVAVGDELTAVEFPITVYRLVMVAGANRDFNSIHHNTEYARVTGADEMYANTLFLLGMWERAVRDWIGDAGQITAIRGFRMRSFNYAGTTTTVRGRVLSAADSEAGALTLEVWSENNGEVSVGPGQVDVVLPVRRA
jgi:acyl dehydratase